MVKITIFDACRLLAQERGWLPETCTDGTQDVVKYSDFWQMCILKKLTSSDRKIKELWKAFRNLGMAKLVNQHDAYIFDLSKFRTVMAIEFETWRGPS